jgi:hypothetical protein
MVVSGICICQLRLGDTNKKRVCKINGKHESVGRKIEQDEKQTHVIREELAIPCSSERIGLRRTGTIKCAATLPQPAHIDGLALSRMQSLEKVWSAFILCINSVQSPFVLHDGRKP